MTSIRDLRKKKFKTQFAIAQELHVSQNTYSQYESKIRQPSLEMLQRLKEVLKCTYDELISALLSPEPKKDLSNKKREANNDWHEIEARSLYRN